MKTIIMTIVVVGVVASLVSYKLNNEPISYVKEHTVEVFKEVEVKEEVKEVDVIEKARLELEKINTDLDSKEKELLEERKAIDAELERLRQTRVSFQSAPEQKELPKP